MSDTISIDRVELQRQADWVAKNFYKGGLPYIPGGDHWRTYKTSPVQIKALASGRLTPDDD